MDIVLHRPVVPSLYYKYGPKAKPRAGSRLTVRYLRDGAALRHGAGIFAEGDVPYYVVRQTYAESAGYHSLVRHPPHERPSLATPSRRLADIRLDYKFLRSVLQTQLTVSSESQRLALRMCSSDPLVLQGSRPSW